MFPKSAKKNHVHRSSMKDKMSEIRNDNNRGRRKKIIHGWLRILDGMLISHHLVEISQPLVKYLVCRGKGKNHRSRVEGTIPWSFDISFVNKSNNRA